MPILPREAKRLRLTTGLSVAQWATLLDVDQADVVNIETGRLALDPALESAWRVAAYAHYLERAAPEPEPADDFSRKVVRVDQLPLRAWVRFTLACGHVVDLRTVERPERILCGMCQKIR